MSRWAVAGLAGLLLPLFFLLPLVAIGWRAAPGLLPALSDPAVGAALWLSLWTSLVTVAVALLLGTPLAWMLARERVPGGEWLESLIVLPLVLPPAVAGIGLLMAFGRRGLVGQWLAPFGIEIAFTSLAVVLAQSFVALPLYIRAATAAFRAVDPRWPQVAATLGASPWRTLRRVTLPLAAPGLLAGVVLCWARALGEFGATIMFAGSLPGVTQTMPIAIYGALERDLNVALAVGFLLILLTLLILALLRRLSEPVLL